MNNLVFLSTLAHHAYCLVESKVEDLFRSLKTYHNIEQKGNPDFFYEKYESFGIDESRRLKELHTAKAFSKESKRIFVIELHGITREAQNALLKIFEEPHEHTHFFILIPSVASFLPTLRSRLYIVEPKKQEHVGIVEAEKFLKLSMKDKIEFVGELAKGVSDEDMTKNDIVQFLSALEAVLATDAEKYQKPLKAILKARDYIGDRSPSVKQLLEFVALSF